MRSFVIILLSDKSSADLRMCIGNCFAGREKNRTQNGNKIYNYIPCPHRRKLYSQRNIFLHSTGMNFNLH